MRSNVHETGESKNGISLKSANNILYIANKTRETLKKTIRMIRKSHFFLVNEFFPLAPKLCKLNGSVQVFLLLCHFVEMQENISVSSYSMTKPNSFPKQSLLPCNVSCFSSVLEIYWILEYLECPAKAETNTWSSVAPLK